MKQFILAFCTVILAVSCSKELTYAEYTALLKEKPDTALQTVQQVAKYTEDEQNMLIKLAYDMKRYDIVIALFNNGVRGNWTLFDAIIKHKDDNAEQAKLYEYVRQDKLKRYINESIKMNSTSSEWFPSLIAELPFEEFKTRLEQGSRAGYIDLFGYGTNLLLFLCHSSRINDKKQKLELLLTYNPDVTVTTNLGTNVFTHFSWSPIDEDYTAILDEFIRRGADIHHVADGYTVLQGAMSVFFSPELPENAERYMEYLFSRGVKATQADIDYLDNTIIYMLTYRYIEEIPGERQRLLDRAARMRAMLLEHMQ
mgnify:CR=1 FL=1